MSSNTATPESTSPVNVTSSPRRRRAIAVPAAFAAVAALTLLSACGSAAPDLSAQVAVAAAVSSDPAVIPCTRSAVTVTVPEGATGVTITAIGGGGGGAGSDNQGGSLGAQVSGLIPLSAGEQLVVSVGEEGANIKMGTGRALGGWGGLSSTGGNGGPNINGGDSASASGGGATTVQLVQSPTSTVTVLVAGGGGGAASMPFSDSLLGAAGGNAGTNVTGSTATGDAGHTEKDGGAAGAAGAAPTSAGTTGTDTDGEYSGGGGGGGGGLVGGTGGSGANNHSGGGGGAGSSMFDPTLLTNGAITVAPSQFSSVNGQVTLAWTMS